MAKAKKAKARAKAPRSSKRRKAAPAPQARTRVTQAIRLRADRIRNDSEGLPRPQGAGFTVHAEAAGVTTIDIYDVIGFFGVTHVGFRAALKSIRSNTIRVRINSPGGDVFDGLGIYNDLVSHSARIEVEIVGLAASAASLIAMAGDQISIADNAFIMIHNAWVGVVGDRNELAKAGRVLQRIDAALARTYAMRTKVGVDEVSEMMDDETWFDSEEAVDMGFADEVTVPDTASAALAYDLSAYFNVPPVLVTAAEGTNDIDAAQIAPAVQGEDLSQLMTALRGFADTLKGQPHVVESSAARQAA